MVKVKRKPFEEIVDSISRYERVLNIGCGGCASVCLGGGQREVQILNQELRLYFEKNQITKQIDAYIVERACNKKYFLNLDDVIKNGNYDVIITMCCSAGTQLLAEIYNSIPIFPAVNTIAIGIDRDIGLYEEKCRACGNCIIGYTGGICPITRCAKSLFNGPCGGTNKGMCEINPNIPCAWCEIYKRLKAQNRLEDILKIYPPVDWKNQMPRTIVQYGYEKRYTKK